MSKIEKIDEFLTKYSNFHEDLIDFKKSIDVNIDQDNELFENITNYLNTLKQAIIDKETNK